ncbi:DNA mismatch repair endonuclease MutL [Pleionea sediminis]|uniref:DNA mismatch repair endonuclease MutL n=1 Tax=Pleionea sediminis TaxID=2569479 RepID=UPI00118641E1|nr:DNA mismatch repair endonuclease MutL [Pleionea sediminis]
MNRIQQLDNQLANQIAAGEVVERPASVVKELIENSVDAGASRIDIDIERGGARLIRIVDDGFGIHQQDLALALSRHATSKIRSFSDLCAVESMGFRGEALASIASVSRLLLRSRQAESEQGWQAEAEGRDMKVNVSPAAAMTGTCVEVRDLFFNTPARRKFLRTEKTEFTHVEDTVKREALAHPAIAFALKHNGRVVKRYPAVNSEKLMQEKLKAACGISFVKNALHFNSALEHLSISGWLASPSYHRSESDTQFIFINGRPVKDRLLSHAIRQSYSGLIPQGRFASYVIYIQCPPEEVDVNVHPTKHEVRFRQPRQVHDFLVKLLHQCLSESDVFESTVEFAEARSSEELTCSNETALSEAVLSEIAAGDSFSSRPQSHHFAPQTSARTPVAYSRVKPSSSQVAEHLALYENFSSGADEKISPDHSSINPVSSSEAKSFNHHLINDRYFLLTKESSIWLVDALKWFSSEMLSIWEVDTHQSKPLLVPKMVAAEDNDVLESPEFFDNLAQLGIELTPVGEKQVMLRRLPVLSVPIAQEFWEKALTSYFSKKQTNISTESLKQDLVRTMSTLNCSSDKLDWLYHWCQSTIKDSDQWQRFALGLSHEGVEKRLGQII